VRSRCRLERATLFYTSPTRVTVRPSVTFQRQQPEAFVPRGCCRLAAFCWRRVSCDRSSRTSIAPTARSTAILHITPGTCSSAICSSVVHRWPAGAGSRQGVVRVGLAIVLCLSPLAPSADRETTTPERGLPRPRRIWTTDWRVGSRSASPRPSYDARLLSAKKRTFLARNHPQGLSALDDGVLEEVIEEQVDVQHVARREENALAWSGNVAGEPRGIIRTGGRARRASRLLARSDHRASSAAEPS
jgi:hypothetical protein